MKKIIAVLMCLALFMNMLAACGETTSANDSETEMATAAASLSDVEETNSETAEEDSLNSDEDEARSAEEEEDSGDVIADEMVEETSANYLDLERSAELPIVEDTETLTCWVSFMSMFSQYMPNGYDDNGTFQGAEALTNVHIDWNEVASDAAGEQFNLMIASGDYCDMISGFLDYYSEGADAAIEEDIIIPLNDYLDEYAQNYVTLINADEDNLKLIETDSGNIASFYIFDDEVQSNTQGLVIRQDWLDELGLATPVTYNDFESVLLAFKSAYDCTDPILMTDSITYDGNFLSGGYGISATIIADMGSAEPWYQVDGEVKFGLVEDGFFDYCMMLNQWYQEGLINQNFLLENSNLGREDEITMLSDGSVGIAMISRGYFEDLSTSGLEYDDDYQMVGIADAVLNEGDTIHFNDYNTHVSNATMCITTQCADPELAVQWLDFWYTDEGFLLANWGVEGESYVLDEDGNPEWSDYYLEDPTHRFPYTSTLIPSIKTDTDSSSAYPEAVAAVEVWNSNRDDAYAISDKVSFSSDDSSTFYGIYSDIQTYMEEQFALFVTGDFDEEIFENFKSELYDMGLQTCIDLKQAAYDKFMEK